MQSTSVLDRHRKVLGILYVVSGALWAIGAVVVLSLFAFGSAESARGERAVVLLIGIAASVLLLLLAATGLIGGFGMLKRRAWSKVPVIIFGLLSLPSFPVGTVLGLYTLWFWFQPNAGQLFFPRESEPPGPELGGPGLRRPLTT